MKWGNGQTVPCETIKNSVLYMETRDKLFTEEQYRKQLARYSKRCKQLESIMADITYNLYTRFFLIQSW